jgi:hypothetical protein
MVKRDSTAAMNVILSGNAGAVIVNKTPVSKEAAGAFTGSLFYFDKAINNIYNFKQNIIR